MFHNSWDFYYRSPFGAVESKSYITIRFKGENIDRVETIIFEEERKKVLSMDRENNYVFKINFNVGESSSLLFYYFKIYRKGNILYYGNNSSLFGGEGEVYENNPLPYQISVVKEGYKTPMWFKNSIIYQIFVDRFYNGNKNFKVSNPKENSFIYGSWYDLPMYIRDSKTSEILRWDFYGGNLLGIIKKLKYLKELGVNLIYLNPIFESRSNHKYDTGNYKKIDPMFGDENILKELIKEAKKLNIYIILDGVFNHTGSDSLYFNKFNKYNSLGAFNSKNSPYYNWYDFKIYPDDYNCWWGVNDLPSVNEEEESFKNYIIKDRDSVINHWMKFGIKGWRLDVADELPDSFIEEIKSKTKLLDEDSILIGEVWEDASNKISYNARKKYFSGKSLDGVTNYPFREGLLKFFNMVIDAKILYKSFMSLYENYPRENFYSNINLVGSHDVERINTMVKNIGIDKYGEENLVYTLLKLITIIQFTFPGVPLIYYGDEAGVEGFKDPDNRRTYPWGKEDKKILDWYKGIIKMRNENVVLRTGKWRSFYFKEDVYGYVRWENEFNNEDSNIAIIAINRSKNKNYEFYIDIPKKNIKFKNYLNKDEIIKSMEYKVKIKIEPLEGKVYLS
ncbi:glycoside hydrolase family 13 protein [Clostridium rectalis]|uniref:glycoside hydrolase family 13 protein n=1 Tax=Clostridium rectalis TaxID=2040295 RepID=UPI000F641622|nr:glycoside hydrolase family 13 protein [Clostridium rectalis]